MHGSTRLGVLRLCAVLLVLMAAASPGVAADGKAHHQRLSTIKKGFPARAIDSGKKATETAYLTHILWPPRKCFGVTTSSSPGLTTKMLEYPGTDVDPDAITEIQYDRHGNVIRRNVRRLNWEGTSWNTEVTECAYDDSGGELHRGKLVYLTEHHSVWGKSPVYRATYNSRHQHETETEDYDWDNNGTVDYRLITRYVYDDTGRLVQQLFEGDDGPDGTIDGVTAGIASYDAQGRLTQIVEGYYDVPGGTFIPYQTVSVIYDDAVPMVTSTTEDDYNEDGVADYMRRQTLTYDTDGRLVFLVSDLDYYGRADGGADGVVDSRSETRYEYDADGNKVRETYDNVLDRGILHREEYISEYDARGRLIRTDTSVDIFKDGIADEFSTISYTRDQHGRIVEWLFFDSTRWSSRTFSMRGTAEYSGIGNLIETVFSRWQNDDPPTIDGRITYEHAAGRSGQDGRDRR